MKSTLLLFFVLTIFRFSNGVTRRFPENFMFGTATASYQIEGSWNVSGKGENIWDCLTHTTNLVANGGTGDVACDSYNQYQRDVEMVSQLGVDFYRFSLSWTRILPTGFANQVNPDGIRYYNALIDELLARNITPSVTLYHWDLPQPLQELGGWTNPLIADYFADYANVAFAAFGDRVKYWLTLNEPQICCCQGYGLRLMAPALNMTGIGDYLCSHTMLLGHAKAYHLYNNFYRAEQQGKIGLTFNAGWLEPENDTPEVLEVSETGMQFGLGFFANPIFSQEGDYPQVMKDKIAQKSSQQGYPSTRLKPFTQEQVELIRGTADFLGINHYTSSMGRLRTPEDKFIVPSYDDDQDLVGYANASWPGAASPWLKVVPWGFTKLLGWIRERYNNPEVIIFENGFSDVDELQDVDRISYYHQYLNALLDAIDEGSNVTGYTAWSLMDNFEWLAGYTERFGLFYVDFNSPQRTRTPKASAEFYRQVVKSRSIESELRDIDFELYK